MEKAFIVVRMGDNTGIHAFITVAESSDDIVKEYNLEDESYHIQQITNSAPLYNKEQIGLMYDRDKAMGLASITHLVGNTATQCSTCNFYTGDCVCALDGQEHDPSEDHGDSCYLAEDYRARKVGDK
jgi:hypothetical protein